MVVADLQVYSYPGSQVCRFQVLRLPDVYELILYFILIILIVIIQ